MFDEDAAFENWKINDNFRILGCIISGLKRRFSAEFDNSTQHRPFFEVTI